MRVLACEGSGAGGRREGGVGWGRDMLLAEWLDQDMGGFERWSAHVCGGDGGVGGWEGWGWEEWRALRRVSTWVQRRRHSGLVSLAHLCTRGLALPPTPSLPRALLPNSHPPWVCMACCSGPHLIMIIS